ncbi:MAG: mycothiol system anti-sigma-R factor [Mycobacteriales bacterium]|nr:mycothiol system anti-sigma-R factor [Mycobacteriales bacterium]
MSCGDPHETPCSEVLEQVYLYLDQEQDADHHGKIRIHLDECAPCLREYGLEQAVKALVARCCGGDTPPTDLRERVMLRIQEVRVEIEHVEFREH